MYKMILLLLACAPAFDAIAQSKIPTREIQIQNALLSAPVEKRDSVTVLGYTENNELIVLKKGFNELICLADDPTQSAFSAACYHKDLEPFMKRGRDLKTQGKTSKEIFDIREKEVKAGTLQMPKMPTTLFVYHAADSNYNRATGEIKNGYLRYVIYIPFATAESTGLPLKPTGDAMPWIMHPGTHGAHIMINPPPKK